MNHKLNYLAHLLQLLRGLHRETLLDVGPGKVPPLHGEGDGVLPHGPDQLHDLRVRHEGDEDPVNTDQDVAHLEPSPAGRADQTMYLQWGELLEDDFQHFYCIGEV